MIKKIIIATLILCGVSSAYSQDCFEKVAKQAVEIDSLQKGSLLMERRLRKARRVSTTLTGATLLSGFE